MPSNALQPNLHNPKLMRESRTAEARDKQLNESRAELTKTEQSGDNVKKASKMFFAQFEDSLKLFMNSIKYQDPLDPVDTSEMSKQMFQLSQAQGMFALNDKMEEQNNLLRAGQVLNTTKLIGKTIEVSHDEFNLNNREDVSLSYNIPKGLKSGKDKGVSSAKVEILDKEGRVVYEKKIVPEGRERTLREGRKELIWNGDVNTYYGRSLNSGNPLNEGKFSIRVTAYDSEDNALTDLETKKPVRLPTTTKALLTGSDFSDKVPKIVVGGSKLPLSSIVSIQAQAPTIEAEEASRIEYIKATMAALDESDQDEILDRIKEQSKMAKKDRKLERKLNNLTAEQYELINKEIATRLPTEAIGG
jgi:flagellar basal-body rod modification protein FlgD